MAIVREIVYVVVGNELNRIELIDCGFFRWEVAFYKQYDLTSNFDFYKVDEHSGEDHARANFDKFKQQEKDGFVTEFTIKDCTTKIYRNWQGGFDAVVYRHDKLSIRRTQKNMTTEEAFGYLANAANR